MPTTAIILFVCGMVAAGPAGETIVHLVGGGRVVGHVSGSDDDSPTIRVLLSGGAEVVLARRRVVRLERLSPNRAAYLELAPRAADTLEAQWRMAEWCRERKLADERATHLERVIELEPNHAAARRALGYIHLRGEWISLDDFRRREGLVRHGGRYRIAEEAELLRERERLARTKRHWRMQIRGRLRALDAGNLDATAAWLAAVDDPLAHDALRSVLFSRAPRAVRLAALRAVANIGDDASRETLIRVALDDADEESRHAAVRHLKAHWRPSVTSALAKALGDASNVRVNRAGRALGEMGDVTAVSPLIDALITRHALTAPTAPGGMTVVSFGSDGSFHGAAGAPVRLIATYQNPAVLRALVELTGVNFGYDQTVWNNWRFASKSPAVETIHRD